MDSSKFGIPAADVFVESASRYGTSNCAVVAIEGWSDGLFVLASVAVGLICAGPWGPVQPVVPVQPTGPIDPVAPVAPVCPMSSATL